jgi:phosphoglycerol transferase MdoB-like AlkP superfamily enzyme
LRVGDFCRDQGFDEIYGAGHMQPGGIGTDWRVQDETLFSFIAKTVSDDKPSFNLILSTSDHPPYGLDVYGMGFPLREIPAGLKDRYNGKVSLKTFGHLWYADRSLGDFVAKLEPKLTAPLFAITGDHWSRKFINEKPTLLERTAVPCVLYGKEVLAGVAPPRALAGAHIDIVPTLVELAAPAGFKYHSFGGNLLDGQRPAVGFGLGTVVGPNFIFDVKQPERIEFFPNASSNSPAPPLETLRQLHQATHGLAWWRAIKGSELPADQ